MTKTTFNLPLRCGFTKITFPLYEERLDWGQKKLMLLFAVVPSLVHACNCGVTCIVQCAQLIERALVVNLLGIWKVTQVLQQWWRISPPVLLFCPLWLQSNTLVFTCPSPACDYSPSRAHCPDSWVDPTALSVVAPLLHDHTGSAAERAALARANFTLGFRVFHPGFKSDAAWEIWLTTTQFLLLPVAWAEWRTLASNGCNQTNQRSLRGNQAKGISSTAFWLLSSCRTVSLFFQTSWPFLTYNKANTRKTLFSSLRSKDGPLDRRSTHTLGQHEQLSVSELQVQDAPPPASVPAADLHRGPELWRWSQRRSVPHAGRSVSPLWAFRSHRRVQVDMCSLNT